jgi:hypothetical protein
VDLPTASDPSFSVRLEFDSPVAFTAALAAQAGGAAPAPADAALQLADARLVNVTADAAAAAPLTFYFAQGDAAGRQAAVAATASTAYTLWFEAPLGAAARVGVPGGSYRDAAGNTGATAANLTVWTIGGWGLGAVRLT